MAVVEIRTIDELVAVRENWEQVYAADPNANYFLSWAWIEGAVSAYGDGWRVLAAQPDGPGTDFVAFFPLRARTRKSKRRNAHVTEIEAAGLRMWAQYSGFICLPSRDSEAIPLMAGHLASSPWSELSLKNLLTTDERWQLFVDGFDPKEFDVEFLERKMNDGAVDNLVCPYVDLPASFDDYLLSKVSRSTRQKIRRYSRRVDEDAEMSITIADANTIEDDVESLLALWKDQWRDVRGSATSRVVRKYREILHLSDVCGALHLATLRRDGDPIGAIACFHDPVTRWLHYIVSARDRTDDGFGGWVLHGHAIRWAIENGVEHYDFCHGNEAYKYSYGCTDRRVTYVVIRRTSVHDDDLMEPTSPSLVAATGEPVSAFEQRLPELVGAIDPAVIMRDLSDGETALLHTGRSAFMSLNIASRWLWDQCDGTRSADDYIRSAIETFEWNPTQADAAIREVLHKFIRKGLVARSTTDSFLAQKERAYSMATTRWVWQQRYEMIGVPMVIRSNEESMATNLATLFEAFEVSGRPQIADVVFSAVCHADENHDGVLHDLVRYEPAVDTARFIVAGKRAEAAIMECLVAANSIAISRTDDYPMHSGAVAVGNDVMLMPAISNTGKSTLVAACLQQGFRYVTDEAVVFRKRDGTIVPYPKPFWLRQWSRSAIGIDVKPTMWSPSTFKDAIIDPHSLGDVVELDATELRPTRVLRLDIRPGPPELSELSVGDALTTLVGNSFGKSRRPRLIFDTCVPLAEELDGWRLSYSDPVEAAKLLWLRFGSS